MRSTSRARPRSLGLLTRLALLVTVGAVALYSPETLQTLLTAVAQVLAAVAFHFGELLTQLFLQPLIEDVLITDAPA